MDFEYDSMLFEIYRFQCRTFDPWMAGDRHGNLRYWRPLAYGNGGGSLNLGKSPSVVGQLPLIMLVCATEESPLPIEDYLVSDRRGRM